MPICFYKDFDLLFDEDRTPEALAFLADIVEVCKKHKRWLGHEDGHGAFEIVKEDTTEWLSAAHEVRSK